MVDLNEIKASLSVTILGVADSTPRKLESKYMRTNNKVDGSIIYFELGGREQYCLRPFGTQKMCIYNNPPTATRELHALSGSLVRPFHV
jgi:hypothetical protein